MSAHIKILFFVIGVALVTTIAILSNNNTKQKKNIATMQYRISTLSTELEEANDKIDEMQDQLASVQHFDNDGSLRSGYGSAAGGISFTGDVIETQIDGEFNGWDGETIFKMMDGTIWQQASYDYEYDYMPDVIIYKKGGSYYMRVEDMDESIEVKRIR